MKIIKTILVLISTFSLFYLLGAFYNANFDLKLWSEFSRYCISFLGGIFSIFSSGMYLFNDRINNNDN